MVARRASRRLEGQLKEAQRMACRKDVIVVCSPDDSRIHAAARRQGGTVVLADPHCSIGEKMTLGAAQAAENILLFLDDRACIPAKRLQRYIFPLVKGREIVLSKHVKRRTSLHGSVVQLLNHLAGKKQLGSGSLCEFPFAINRPVFEALDFAAFSPPEVHVRALIQDCSFGTVRVRKTAPLQRQRIRLAGLSEKKETAGRFTADLVWRDQAKAIVLLLQEKGVRGGFGDGDRCRSLLLVPGRDHFRAVYHTFKDV